MTNASAGLIAALKASLATSAAGWVCTAASESSIALDTYTSVDLGTGVIARTTSTRTTVGVALMAAKLRASSTSRSPLEIGYRSLRIAGAFSEGVLVIGGAELRSTDAALDATILALADTFIGSIDAAVTDILDDGPLADDDTIAMPPALLAALKSSLADPDAGWIVQGRVEHTAPQISVSAAPAAVYSDIIVPMYSLDLLFDPRLASAPDQRVPASMTYIGRLDAAGDFVAARVVMNGCQWIATDAALHAAVMEHADAFLADEAASITASLTAGPGD